MAKRPVYGSFLERVLDNLPKGKRGQETVDPATKTVVDPAGVKSPAPCGDCVDGHCVMNCGPSRATASDDPDETEGRKLARAHADTLARAQVSMARHRVSWAERSGES